ncbi:hypothetical protein WR25_10968 isoform B [Diploscapter pachys]|uniref:Zinc-hook domain-containing protein n=1 Tax=Diploscapter pachys TaxID=2018661 RepID=A0A2A2LY33_9BILA|nr:hypothetical protein WR25_10968 isoform B [Diploscapter pachys]
MAYLEQLRIAGIRSYGQTDGETALIRFLRPLTILSGPNGSGKTTIIECLRYIATGTFPPGQMNAFVQDLEIARINRVDASVALLFRDTKGNQVTAIKRLCASINKNRKVQCRTEEPTLMKVDQGGNKVSLSAKVVDFRSEILRLFGLPPAILENVIFCHQESSTWPMSDPKVLKMRFDEIFQLTRFTKAIETMKKYKKELEIELRVNEERALKLGERLNNKLQHEWNKAQCEKKLERGRAKVEELKEKIRIATKKMREVIEQVQRYDENQRKFKEKSIILKSDKERLAYLLDHVLPYNGTEEELRAELENIEKSDEFQNVANRRQQLQTEIAELQTKLDRAIHEKRQKEEHRAQANLQLHQKTALEKEYHELRDKCEDEFGLAGAKEPQVELQNALQMAKSELEAINTEYQHNKTEVAKNLEDAQREQSRLEYAQESIRQKLQVAQATANEARNKLERIEQYNTELIALADKISEKENELLRCPAVDESSVDLLRRQRVESQKKLDTLRTKLQGLNEAESVKKEHEKYMKELKEKEEQLKQLKDKHSESWKRVFEHENDTLGPWGDLVKTRQSVIAQKYNVAESAYRRAELQHTALINKKDSILEEQEKLAKEIEAFNNKINEIADCSPEDLIMKLKKTRKELKETRAKLAPMEGKEALYNSWCEETNDKHCCPLCSRKFATQKQFDTFVQTLQNLSLATPSEAETLRRNAILLADDEARLSQAKVYLTQLKASEQKKEELELTLSETLKEVQELQTELRRLCIHRDEAKALDTAINSIRSDVSLMDSLYEQVVKIDQLQSRLSAQLQKFESDMRNADQFRRDIQNLLENIAYCETESEKLTDAMSRRNKLTNELHELKVAENRYKEEMMEKKRLEDTIVEQDEVIQQCDEELQQARADYPVISQKVQKLRDFATELDATHKVKEKELTVKISSITHALQCLTALCDKLSALQVDDQTVAGLNSDCDKLDARIESLKRQKVNAEAKANDLQGGQNKRRQLRDQLTVIELSAKTQSFEAELQQLVWQGESRDELDRQHNNYSSEKEQAEGENSRIGGKMEELHRGIKEAKLELQKKEYQNVLEELRKVMVTNEVNKCAVMDIENYASVLDKKLIEFHAEKMREVNDNLEELWREVYDGADIESIKIRADKGKASKTRAAYDYCVNMVVEGGIEVEMRDKSSAGQKMLASILIRIALADAFGGVCSMIALDEPTTNLDRDKVEQLAAMLNRLVHTRSKKYKQFQMIVISHDDELVDQLIRGCQPEYTYHLAKNNAGHTIVKKIFSNDTGLGFFFLEITWK